MSYLAAFLIAIITSYINATDSLANWVNSLISEEHPIKQEKEVVVTTSPLTTLPSEYESSTEVFIDLSSTQVATAIEAIDKNIITKDPLAALVNIYCTYKNSDYVRTITGTGFFIDSDGIILTNAHVAQFLLLDGLVDDVSCVIRTGKPATVAYEVDLLYISPAWVLKHAHLITDEAPRGTGERDFALLYVTKSATNDPLPTSFPSLKISTNPLSIHDNGSPVMAAGYPAATAFVGGNFDAELNPKISSTTIGELLTFGRNRPDVLALLGTAVGEQGVSGGPILLPNSTAIGLISTKGDDAAFGVGSLRALSLAYVANTYKEETGLDFIAGLSGDIHKRAKVFREFMVPILKLMLKEEFEM